MSDKKRYYITTAIDYPNSRPHIGTAFEKIGADVQARYRRQEGYDVFFLMGNDENTIKVAKRAAELGLEPAPYCNEMAQQFREVWRSLLISNDDFIQTSEPRHHQGCQQFLQKVYEAGHIYLGTYTGLYCEGCESFKTEKEVKEAGGVCPDHKVPPVQRAEPCYYFALSKFQDKLLDFYRDNPDFIQPESRRNEVLALVQCGLQDLNISRIDQAWGIRIPFDERYTIYVWFDALLNYLTGIGFGTDPERFAKWWPADLHVIGKDITRFHCALWPAMLFAAGLQPPKRVFGHGFVHIKGEKISKSQGNAIEPMDIITQFGPEAFRYYFLRECPFPGDGDFSWDRFRDVYNSDLANNLGNLYSRVVKLISQYFEAELPGTAGTQPNELPGSVAKATLVEQFRVHLEACQYSQALEKLWRGLLDAANQYADKKEPWKLAKVDKEATRQVLFDLVEPLRCAAILLKPFLPSSMETIYRSFNFEPGWESVQYKDVAQPLAWQQNLRVLAELENGKVKPLFPRFNAEK